MNTNDRGRPGIPAPDLIGLDLVAAVDLAASEGLSLNAVKVAGARGTVGVILGQSPSPGIRMSPLWRIHVLVQEARLVSAPEAPTDR